MPCMVFSSLGASVRNFGVRCLSMSCVEVPDIDASSDIVVAIFSMNICGKERALHVSLAVWEHVCHKWE